MSSVVSNLVKDVPVPKVYKVRQVFDDSYIKTEDISSTILANLAEKDIKIEQGMSVAITAGSRGIANMPLILKTLVDFVYSQGGKPFLAATMGSHGGATSEGQRKILEGFKITEESMGCPIKSSMETVSVGLNAEGVEVFASKDVLGADGVIVVNRIKPHTCFRGPFESGIMKMMAIGIGKQFGAEHCHKEGFQNMAKNVRLFGETVMKAIPLLCGVAILENAFDRTHELVVMKPDEIHTLEPIYLKKAIDLLPKIHTAECEVLVCDTIGKNFSGSGMDSNITGTFVTPYASGGLISQRVAVLDLSDESHHNATGTGMAHVTTRRLFDKIDFEQTYPNVLTSTVIENVRIPMVMKSDKQAIQACLRTCTGYEGDEPRLIRIANSLEVGTIYMSYQYLDEINANENLVLDSELMDLPFDENGNLIDLGHII
ncbi:MAG: DUF362 domain-containing protein [Clostridia bacterium]